MQTFVSAMFLAAVLQTPASGKWRVVKSTDPMTDKVQTTIVLRSDDGLATLRVVCAAETPTIMITLPKDTVIMTGSLTVAEIRFDKAESEVFVLEELKHQLLISLLGASADEKNLSFVAGPADAPKVIATEKTERSHIIAVGNALVEKLRGSRRLAYRFTLLTASKGAQGAFSTLGFQSASKALRECIPPTK